VTTRASGTFDVKLTPQTLADPSADVSLGRLAIDKQLHGDLEGSSKGEMVPDSGTAELAGLAGDMTITIADGRYSYEF
jgi:hypothetical protein